MFFYIHISRSFFPGISNISKKLTIMKQEIEKRREEVNNLKKVSSQLKMFLKIKFQKLNRIFANLKGTLRKLRRSKIHERLHRGHRRHPQQTGRARRLFEVN